MKKLFGVFLVAVLILAGCGADGKTVGDGVITVWTWDTTYNIPAIQAAADIYTVDHPDFKFEIIETSQNDIRQKLHTSLQAGVVDELPDIVMLGDEYAQTFLSAYPESFMDITDKVDLSKFDGYKVEAASLDGKNYGMPFDNAVFGLYYRLDYIEAAGYTEEDMQNLTYDEYYKICEDVYNKTGKKMTEYNVSDAINVRMMMQTAGQSYFENNDPTTISENKALKKAIETSAIPMNKEWAHEITDWETHVNATASGDVGSTVEGAYYSSVIEGEADQANQWRIAPPPRLDFDGSVNASTLGGGGWYIVNGKGDEDLALDFLNSTFNGSEELYDRMLEEANVIGVWEPALDSDVFDKPIDFYGGQAIFRDFSDWSNNVPVVSWDENHDLIPTYIKGNWMEYLNGNMTIDELLQIIEDQFISETA